MSLSSDNFYSAGSAFDYLFSLRLLLCISSQSLFDSFTVCGVARGEKKYIKMHFLVPLPDNEVETGEVGALGDPDVDPELLELHFAAEMPEGDLVDPLLFPEVLDIFLGRRGVEEEVLPPEDPVVDGASSDEEDNDVSSDGEDESEHDPWLGVEVPEDADLRLENFNVSDDEYEHNIGQLLVEPPHFFYPYSDDDEEEEEEEEED